MSASEVREGGISSGSKLMIGCAVTAAVALAVLLIGGYFLFRDAMVTDPAKVEAIFKDLTGGATFPGDYESAWGIQVLGKPLLAAASDGAGRTLTASIDAKGAKAGEELPKNAKLLGKRKLTVAGTEVDCDAYRVAKKGDDPQLYYSVQVAKPGGGHVRLQLIAPEKDFDASGLEELMAAIQSLRK